MNHCNQCEHNWESRKNKLPRQCPKCWSNYWNRPKRHERINFNFMDLKIGEPFLFPWYSKNDKPDPVKNAKIGKALTTHAHRHKRTFRRLPTARGLLVTRLT